MKNENIVSAVDKFEENVWRIMNKIMESKLSLNLTDGLPYLVVFDRKHKEIPVVEEMNIISRLEHLDLISIIEGPKTIGTNDENQSKTHPMGAGYVLKLNSKFGEVYEYYRRKYQDEESAYKLTIYQETGRVEYTTPNSTYATVFRKNDTALMLLIILANYPYKTQSPLSICKKLDGMTQGKTGKNENDERRIRDAIRHIRKRLSLTENKPDDKLFLVDNKNFGIGCDVLIKK